MLRNPVQAYQSMLRLLATGRTNRCLWVYELLVKLSPALHRRKYTMSQSSCVTISAGPVPLPLQLRVGQFLHVGQRYSSQPIMRAIQEKSGHVLSTRGNEQIVGQPEVDRRLYTGVAIGTALMLVMTAWLVSHSDRCRARKGSISWPKRRSRDGPA